MKGKIYKIIHLQSNICYVGSTLNQRLKDRWQNHKQDYKKFLNGKDNELSIYPYFTEYGIENFKMILIKEYEVCDRKHLEAYEQLFINKLKPVNKNNPFRITYLSQRKYNQENKELLAENSKQYYIDNKESIKKKVKSYQINNKISIAQRRRIYQQENKDLIKEYYKEYKQDNKDTIAEYQKKYKQDNKDTIAEYQKEYQRKNKNVIAERNKGYCIFCNQDNSNIKRHLKTATHQKNEALYYFNELNITL